MRGVSNINRMTLGLPAGVSVKTSDFPGRELLLETYRVAAEEHYRLRDCMIIF